MWHCIQKSRGRGALLDVEKGLGPRSDDRSRSRSPDSCYIRSSYGRVVDPDYFVVPPQPIKFPASFKMFSETEGRKGITKRTQGKKKTASV